MKASYQTVQRLLEAGMPICEYENSNHKWMEIGGRVLTEKAKQLIWKNDYLVDVKGTEMDNVIAARFCLVHVWVRGH